jgi:glycosyl transferase family 25
MRVAIINLEKDAIKRNRAIEILKNNNIDYFLYSAIYGRELPENELLRLQTNAHSFSSKKGRNLNPAEIGLYLSHINLLKWFLQSDLNTLCVLEDDFELEPYFNECLIEIESKLDYFDFEILMIGHFLHRKDKGILGSFRCIKKGKYITIKNPLEPNYGTHAYIITRIGAKKIIEKYSEPLCPIDHILGVSEVFDINRKITSKPIVFQSDLFDSSIQSDGFVNQNLIVFYIKRFFKKIIYSMYIKLAVNKMKIYISQNM